jgi:hypothetical protein
MLSLSTRVAIQYQVKHSIDLTHGYPLHKDPIYMCYVMENEENKHKIQKLIMKGHIISGSSPCGSPIVLIHMGDSPC